MKARRPRRTAEDRLSRLLVMLPWLMEQESVPLAEVAARFDLDEAEVVADLELVSMCGLPPYVDELIDVFIDEGMVFVGVPRLFTRPLRLNSMEAFELLVAARSAMELPGADPAGPLGRGLAKLAKALGGDGAGGIGMDVEILDGSHVLVEQVVAATEAAQVLEIHYWNPNREEVNQRTVWPLQVFADRGNWYLVAIDRSLDKMSSGSAAGDLRTFRVDRIVDMSVPGETFEAPQVPLPEPGEWFTDEGIPHVRLRLRAPALWITERYPMIEVGVRDQQGWTPVTLAVVSPAWLERLLLRLGPEAEVVSPLDVRAQVRAAAASILEVYAT
jgi:proteasome accessory factor C